MEGFYVLANMTAHSPETDGVRKSIESRTRVYYESLMTHWELAGGCRDVLQQVTCPRLQAAVWLGMAFISPAAQTIQTVNLGTLRSLFQCRLILLIPHCSGVFVSETHIRQAWRKKFHNHAPTGRLDHIFQADSKIDVLQIIQDATEKWPETWHWFNNKRVPLRGL
ncbi:hypothetical protein N7461_001801 [Penicillium sp. DV-2018c]|nr:hypothetical protein N7461_001801 [Penicillium sp. DV-2018c]